jgi:hypothetical protein
VLEFLFYLFWNEAMDVKMPNEEEKPFVKIQMKNRSFKTNSLSNELGFYNAISNHGFL